MHALIKFQVFLFIRTSVSTWTKLGRATVCSVAHSQLVSRFCITIWNGCEFERERLWNYLNGEKKRNEIICTLVWLHAIVSLNLKLISTLYLNTSINLTKFITYDAVQERKKIIWNNMLRKSCIMAINDAKWSNLSLVKWCNYISFWRSKVLFKND